MFECQKINKKKGDKEIINTLTLIQNLIDDFYTLLSKDKPVYIHNFTNLYAQLILIEESYIIEKGDETK